MFDEKERSRELTKLVCGICAEAECKWKDNIKCIQFNEIISQEQFMIEQAKKEAVKELLLELTSMNRIEVFPYINKLLKEYEE